MGKYILALGLEADKENTVSDDYFQTIQLIQQIIEDTSFTDLQSGLESEKSKLYDLFNTHGKRSFGMLLHMTVALDAFLNQSQDLSSMLKDKYQSLKGDLALVFKEPRNNMSKINEIIDGFTSLTNDLKQTQHPNEITKNFLKSMYVFTQTIGITLGNLKRLQKKIASRKGIKTDDFVKKLDNIRENVVDTIHVVAPEEIVKSIEEGLDELAQSFYRSLAAEDRWVEENFIKIEEYNKNLYQNLSELYLLKETKELIENNFNKGFGEYRQSFKSIIGIEPLDTEKLHKIEQIIQSLDDEEKQYWQNQLAEIKKTGYGKQVAESLINQGTYLAELSYNGIVTGAEAIMMTSATAILAVVDNTPSLVSTTVGYTATQANQLYSYISYGMESLWSFMPAIRSSGIGEISEPASTSLINQETINPPGRSAIIQNKLYTTFDQKYHLDFLSVLDKKILHAASRIASNHPELQTQLVEKCSAAKAHQIHEKSMLLKDIFILAKKASIYIKEKNTFFQKLFRWLGFRTQTSVLIDKKRELVKELGHMKQNILKGNASQFGLFKNKVEGVKQEEHAADEPGSVFRPESDNNEP